MVKHTTDQELSGRYVEVSSKAGNRTTDRIRNLRVDVDGERPLNIVSGDFSATGHLGSFRFAVKKKGVERDKLILTGTDAHFTNGTHPFEGIKVIVPLGLGEQSPDIMVQLIGASSVLSNAVFRKQSQFFRKISIHNFCEEGVQPLDSFDTKSLDSPARRSRPVSLRSAFAEAGLEVMLKVENNRIPHPSFDGVWVDSELKNTMNACSLSFKQPQGCIWLLSALEYVICTVKGLNINLDPPRRGCVVFQAATGWETAEEKRLRLFIYLHELGHCLNLQHPWMKSGKDGYSTLSWMNYPWRYRLSEQVYGTEAFWRRFNFEFSDSELLSLRHNL